MSLLRLRMHVADCDRDLRNAHDDYVRWLGVALKDMKLKSTTKEARELEIAGIFSDSGEYQARLALYRDAEWKRDRALAELESAKDARRAAELESRDRRTAAYERLAIQRDKPDYASNYDDDEEQISDQDWITEQPWRNEQ